MDMGMQHEYTAWKSSKICSMDMDMQQEYTAWKSSKDMQP
jgi:hypothetical protein